MNRKSFLFIFTVLLCLFTACKNNFLVEEEEIPYIVFNSSLNDTRTIFPDEAMTATTGSLINYSLYSKQGEDSYSLLKTWETYQTFIQDQIFISERGLWDFKLTAETVNGILYSAEIKDKDIKKGENLLDFILEIDTYAFQDTGIISLTMAYPSDEIFYPEVTLYPYDETAGFGNGIIQPDNTITQSTLKHYFNYTKAAVASGFYRLKFSLYADEAKTLLLNEYTELVCVSDGAISKAFRTITSIENTYQISYDFNQGHLATGKTVTETYTRKSDDIIFPAGDDVLRTGYSFAGWFIDEAFENQLTQIPTGTSENISILAKWTANSYKVSFSGNNSTSGTMDTITCTYDQTYTIPDNAFTRTGYILSGWNSKADGKGTAYEVGGSIKNLSSTKNATVTLYAVWTPITYTVKFDGNGATRGSTASLTCKYDSTYTPLNGFYRILYTFANWNTKKDGSGTSYTSFKNLTSENGKTITLYAKWTFGIPCSRLNSDLTELGETTDINTLYNIVITDTTPDLNTLKTALKNNPNKLVKLDLSKCTGLTTIDCEGSGAYSSTSAFSETNAVGAFAGCMYLVEIVLPNTIKTIGKYAFCDCPLLLTINIPSSVTSIGEDAFGYTGLSIFLRASIAEHTSVYYSGTFKQWCQIKLDNYYSSPFLLFANHYFNGSKLPATLTASNFDGLKTIPKYSCAALFGVTSISLPSSITSIEEGAFYSCTSLTSIDVPSSVTSIGAGAFINCYNLQSFTIPYSVTSISDSAFCSCESLTTISIPSAVTSIGDGAFENCTNLQTVTISSSVKSIGDYAFSSCESLSTISIPSSVTSIGKYAFKDCSNLETITLSSSLSSIKEGTFSGCEKIQLISIPASVQIIKEYAFINCTGLLLISFEASSQLEFFERYAVTECSSSTIIMLPGLLSLGEKGWYRTSSYKNAQLKENGDSVFGSYITQSESEDYYYYRIMD